MTVPPNAPAFNVGRTVNLIKRAARDRRFITYGDIADAYGADFRKIRSTLFVHLDAVVKEARARGIPLVTAIVVDQANRQTGDFDVSALSGFIKAARAAGYSVTDGHRFLREQQQSCFTWGAETSENAI